jgi:hypothetical protein
VSIELSENTIGIWAVNLRDESDWIGAVWRDGDNWIMEYRFRYYVDDKTFDSEDVKNWYTHKIPVDKYTEDEVISAMRMCVELLWKASGGKRYEIMMTSAGLDQMMADMKKWPMISMKFVPIKGANKPSGR